MHLFCVATAALAAGRVDRASADYAALLAVLKEPIKGLEHSQRILELGSLNGRALSEAALGRAEALTLADALGTDAFFATHAAVARTFYYAGRGERDKANLHRARAELLALRGGISFSAAVTLSMMDAYTACLSEDAIGLVQAIACSSASARPRRRCALTPRSARRGSSTSGGAPSARSLSWSPSSTPRRPEASSPVWSTRCSTRACSTRSARTSVRSRSARR